MTTSFDPDSCRQNFPALEREVDGLPAVYFDGPAGSQVPRIVIDAMSAYLGGRNANHGGHFLTSRESDAMLAEAHRAAADFMGAADADLVAFGAFWATVDGEVFALFVIAVAAAEVGVGLAMVLLMYRNRRSIDLTAIDQQRG